MTTDACVRYLEDPEAHPGHLEECAKCRALIAGLDNSAPPDARAVHIDALPLAPWEGSSHRAWPIVLGGALAVLSVASGLFLLAGVSPFDGVARAVASSVPSLDAVMTLLRLVSGAVQHAPAKLQIGIGLSFIAVNGLFILLLRRAPRGIDV
ncbi:MAG TPA: hypothetical protein VEZ11_11100 [Thermoanaerobaculia bacterium]|nr:hypothetical protein [Thermoanaerobaculia bacterium]